MVGVWFASRFSSESSFFARFLYLLFLVLVLMYACVVVFAPVLAPVCDTPTPSAHPKYQNHDYVIDMCSKVRYTILLGLNKWECDMCTRVLVSLGCGSLVGWERRRADRPAGIRTMAMVSLGACVFTIDSMFAFMDSPMSWDASRVSAAIPSGVGFLGAASIWKGTTKDKDEAPEVHGLTTATSVWFAAAVGILVGGALYVPALFGTAASIVYLRFAPRSGAVMATHEMSTTYEDSRGHGRLGPSLDELRLPLTAATPPAERRPSLRS